MADFSGMAELEAAIAAKIRQAQAALPEVVKAGAAPIFQEIDKRMPRDTGATEHALETTVAVSGQAATATVQVRDSAVGEVNEAAVFLEFGTSKMPAEPSFRPGFSAGKDAAVQAASVTLKAALEK